MTQEDPYATAARREDAYVAAVRRSVTELRDTIASLQWQGVSGAAERGQCAFLVRKYPDVARAVLTELDATP